MEGLGQGISNAAFHLAWAKVAVTAMEIGAVFIGIWLAGKVVKIALVAMAETEKPKSNPDK